MKVEIDVTQVIEKLVAPAGTSGRVYVPHKWIGKTVKVMLIEE